MKTRLALLLVLGMLGGILLLATPADASGYFGVRYGCHDRPGQSTYNVVSADEAQNVYGVPWTVRSIQAHVVGNPGACNDSSYTTRYRAARQTTTIVFKRAVWNGSGFTWTTCAARDYDQSSAHTQDVHLDASPGMSAACRAFDWPFGYSYVEVQVRTWEFNASGPYDEVNLGWNV